jgi:glycosyltransferase involved in cell wall biosynthesis
LNRKNNHEHSSQNNNIIWRIEGPFDSTYSLALVNREIARALSKIGVDVLLHSTEGPGDFEPSQVYLDANPDIDALNKRSKELPNSDVSVGSRNLYPPRVEDMDFNCNLLHSYAWEETAFPLEWVQNFNKHLSGLTCLSNHVMKNMVDSGISLPTVVSGCGADHWDRVTPSSSGPLDNIETTSFRFLHVSSFFPRKGPNELLEAFGRTFTNRDDVCLVIKTFPNPHNEVHDQLEFIRNRYPDYPQVVLIEDELSDSDLKALYQQCHVLVAPSCAEGFGLPLAEAMLSGIPVITTGWSGQLDFCNDENSWLVDYKFEQAKTHFKLIPSAWVVADVDALSTAMLSAFRTTDEVRRSMAQKGRDLLMKDFTWEQVAKRLVAFYQKIQNIEPVKPAKIAWVSTWNTKCGIASYSEHLTTDFENQPFVFAARADDLIVSETKNYIRCWEAGDNDNLSELSSAISDEGSDVVVIQFNFGFFHEDNLYGFVKEQKEAGRSVVIDMHATLDPPQAPHKKLCNYIKGLALADRVLVHSCADMNRLKSLGVVDNLVLFPLGILDLDAEANVPELKEPTIATYGFCLPHKGLEQIVEAIGILKEEGLKVNLRMVNAEYPHDSSSMLVQKLKTKINDLGLDGQVMLETRFLPDEESLGLLKGSDLVVFGYSPTSESASAAVRYGFTSGKPTLVTDIPIFEEFGDSVWKAKDNSPVTLAHSIRQALNDISTSNPVFIEKQELADSWRDQHRYSRLAQRLQGMLQGIFVQKNFS